MWRALTTLATVDPRPEGMDFEHLAARAELQRSKVRLEISGPYLHMLHSHPALGCPRATFAPIWNSSEWHIRYFSLWSLALIGLSVAVSGMLGSLVNRRAEIIKTQDLDLCGRCAGKNEKHAGLPRARNQTTPRSLTGSHFLIHVEN